MSNIKKLLLTLVLLFIGINCTQAKNDDYEVSSYEIDIKVDNDYNYEYNENIDLIFNKSNILVTNEIPYDSQNLKINSKYMVETSKTKLVKVLSENNSTKNLTYTYTLPNSSQNKELFTINIPSNYNNDLNNINFTIELPLSFNKNNIDFYLNDKKLKDIDFTIEDNVIIGSYSFLKEDDVLTVKIDYNKIYFSGLTILAIIVPIILSILSYIIWYIYGRDLRYKVKKESKLPTNLTTLDIALINNGTIKNDDVIYFLLDLANKGYVNIKEDDNNSFTITRLKDYDGKNYKEASFLRALFRKNMSVTFSEYVEAISEKTKNPYHKELDKKITKDDIKHRFIRASKNVLSIIHTNDEKSKYFESKSSNKKGYLLFSITAILVMVTSIPFIEINKIYLLPLSVLFSIITLYVLITLVENTNLKRKSTKVTILVVLAIIIGIIMLVPSFRRNRAYLLAFLTSCSAVIFILFLYKYMPKRTIYGTRLYSKIEGYKKYLNEITDSEVQENIKEDKNYLYNILPYTLELGLQDFIYYQMKKNKASEPSWYKINDFSIRKLFNSINRLKELTKDEEE